VTVETEARCCGRARKEAARLCACAGQGHGEVAARLVKLRHGKQRRELVLAKPCAGL
jgi:hypothetical protein